MFCILDCFSNDFSCSNGALMVVVIWDELCLHVRIQFFHVLVWGSRWHVQILLWGGCLPHFHTFLAWLFSISPVVSQSSCYIKLRASSDSPIGLHFSSIFLKKKNLHSWNHQSFCEVLLLYWSQFRWCWLECVFKDYHLASSSFDTISWVDLSLNSLH